MQTTASQGASLKDQSALIVSLQADSVSLKATVAERDAQLAVRDVWLFVLPGCLIAWLSGIRLRAENNVHMLIYFDY
jgi:hypothetical protein